MAQIYAQLKSQVREFNWNLSTRAGDDRKPVVILVHGLGGDRNDWMDPFQERNWPYDHQHSHEERDMGVHSKPPVAQLPGLPIDLFFSPRLKSNTKGVDGSDDRSWWNALVKAGFPVVTYSQVGDLMVPFERARWPSSQGSWPPFSRTC